MRIPLLFATAAFAVAAAPAGTNWASTTTITPEGGFRMGNPAARVKLVEYGSLTCSHCAQFARQSAQPLTSYIRSGKVSFEYRNFVLNGVDVTASLLARCGGPAKFFRLADQIYASQPQWMDRFGKVTPAERDKINALPEKERMIRVAEVSGLMQIAARNGVSAVQVKRCIADEAGLARLEALSKRGTEQGVAGTPTFFINGRRAEVNSWATIEPLIQQAGGR